MEDMIKMIAEAPQEQRTQMLTDRLNMIAAQPEPQRLESVKGLVMATSKLDEKKKALFISDRTNIISKLSPENKSAILVARAKSSSQLPENINMTDMKLTIKAVKQWSQEKQNMFLQGLKKAFQTANAPMPDIEAMMK